MKNLFKAAIVISSLIPTLAWADEDIVSILKDTYEQTPVCSSSSEKVYSTLERLSTLDLYSEHKLILINIPSHTLTAYEDGVPKLQMEVVVGKPSTQTPVTQTAIRYVQFNPSWHVPSSILHESQWQKNLLDEKLLRDNDFVAYDRNGRIIEDVANRRSQVARLVQLPNRNNALGLVKFGLKGVGDIYMHDTNEQSVFDDRNKNQSHGCVRVEHPFKLAAWVLGIDEETAHSWQKNDDQTIHSLEREIPVIIGYFTAWPDASGEIHYYKDAYHLDEAEPECRTE